MIGRMGRRDATKERLAFGARVAVDQHRLRPAFARPAAVDAVLPALAIARIIGPGPVDLRRLAVVFLEPPPRLVDKLPLQIGGRREQRVGVGVLRLEQRADFGRQTARIAQHLAPILGPDPGVLVGPGHAMRRAADWANVGARRRGQAGKGGAIGHEAGRLGYRDIVIFPDCRRSATEEATFPTVSDRRGRSLAKSRYASAPVSRTPEVAAATRPFLPLSSPKRGRRDRGEGGGEQKRRLNLPSCQTA